MVSEQHEQVTIVSHSWTGPLPSPNDFQHYNNILPGAAERILAMAEREEDHRHSLEHREATRSLIGLIFGFTTAISALIAGAGLVFTGHGLAGTIIVGVDLVALTGVFVYGSRMHREETIHED